MNLPKQLLIALRASVAAAAVIAAAYSSARALNTLVLEPHGHFSPELVGKAQVVCSASKVCKSVAPARFPALLGVESPAVGFVVATSTGGKEREKLLADLRAALADSPKPMVLREPIARK